MTVQLSTPLANLIADGRNVRAAVGNFVRNIYSGTIPTGADSAINGTLLAQLTESSGTATYEVLPVWKVTIGGTVGGNVTINMGGAPMHATVTSVTDTGTTAGLVAAAINGTLIKNFGGFTASAVSSVVYITGPVGSGANLNALVCTSTVTSNITATVASSGLPDGNNGTTLGVAAANCCDYDQRAVAGVLTSSQTWSCTSAAASGTATWYRDVYSASDTGGVSTSYLRKQGTITSIGGGGDFELASTTITATTPVTATGATFTVPAN